VGVARLTAAGRRFRFDRAHLASLALTRVSNVPREANEPPPIRLDPAHPAPPGTGAATDSDTASAGATGGGGVRESGDVPADLLGTTAAGPAAVRGGALRIVAFLLGSVASVVSAAFLFRHLGLHETSHYVLALTLAAIVAAVSDLGLTAVGVKELATRPPQERDRLARDLLGLRITLTLLGGALVTAFAAIAYSGRLAFGVFLACVGLLLQATQDNLALSLVVGLRLGWIAVLEAGRQLLTMALVIALVALGATLNAFLAVSIPVGAVLLLLTIRLIRGSRSLRPAFSPRRWRAFTRAMLPYSLAVAASAIYFRISVVLVSLLATPTEQGNFAASFRIVEVLTAIPLLVVGSAFPIFASAAGSDPRRLSYAAGRVFEVALIAGAWLAVSLGVGAEVATRVIGGAEFKGADPLLAIQGVALAAMFVSVVWGNVLLSLGRYRAILVINVSMLALNAALVSALVPIDGARGAAIATAVAEIAAACIQATAVIRARPWMRPSLRHVPFIALATACAALPALLTGLPAIVRLLLSTLLFVAVLLVTRAYPRELLDLLPWRRAAAGVTAAR
jgi:O-antigen/teichoic acid export membrane protein